MELSKSHKYNKSTEEILDAFTSSEEYYKKKYEAMGAKDIEVLEFGKDGDIFRIKTKRAVPANAPGFAKKILGDWNTMIEVDEWVIHNNEVKAGEYTVDIVGTPISIRGEIILKPRTSGEGCEHIVNAIIVVKIPLIGKKIAKFIADETSDTLDQEFEYNFKNI